MDQLPASILGAVEDAVRAVVAHDDGRLATLAQDVGDLYLWTRDHGSYGTVNLVDPPGSVALWNIDVTEMDDGGKHVAVPMWTQQEGRSDLTLELELRESSPGEWQARILGLHVL